MVKRIETEVAAKVIEWLRSTGWTVYQEICPYYGGNIIDILAVKDGEYWAIEVKTSLSLAVMAQALRNKDYAHYSSFAVPIGTERGDKVRHFAQIVSRKLGIGFIEVCDFGSNRFSPIMTKVAPVLQPNPLLSGYKGLLIKKAENFAPAGNNEGKFWSHYRNTIEQAREYIEKHPGCTSKEIVENIKHHYNHGSAAQALLTALRKWEESWCTVDSTKRPFRVYLREDA